MPSNSAEPFASVDAAWLRMEDSTNLMMITAVLMFDECLDMARLQEVIEQRLLSFDRFRKRVVTPHNGTPHWEIDPTFSLRSHLHRVALPAPGDKAMLEEFVSDVMSTPLDFSKPLWKIDLVENVGSGCALVVRLHHCIADGIALVRVLLSLTDANADAEWQPPAPRKRNGSPLAQLSTTTQSALESLANTDGVMDIVKVGMSGTAALGKLLFMPPDPQTLFKGKLGVQKRAVWSDPIALADVKAIGKLVGGTINDILLNAVAGALRRYLLAHEATVDGIDIRAAIPVNLRSLDEPLTLGNYFGLVFLTLPVGIEDPFDRLLALQERMEGIKNSPEALVAFGILKGIGLAPVELQDIAVQMFGSKATAVMTNVPGPRETIYMAGKPISNIMFWVPQSGHLALGVSILSYAGHVTLGIATDVGVLPDPDTIIKGFHAELEGFFGLARLLANDSGRVVEVGGRLQIAD